MTSPEQLTRVFFTNGKAEFYNFQVSQELEEPPTVAIATFFASGPEQMQAVADMQRLMLSRDLLIIRAERGPPTKSLDSMVMFPGKTMNLPFMLVTSVSTEYPKEYDMSGAPTSAYVTLKGKAMNSSEAMALAQNT